jgi:hypothetical protein
VRLEASLRAGGENTMKQGCCATDTGQRRRFRMVWDCGGCCGEGESVPAVKIEDLG